MLWGLPFWVGVDSHYFTFWPSTSQNKLSFTLCSIHILIISNEFHKFWMSSDFMWTCAKIGRKWVKTQADQPLLGRPAWHPWRQCHVFDPEAKLHSHNASESWIERRFDRMDRKSCTRIKRPTTQWELVSKSSIHHPGKITSVQLQCRRNRGPTRARVRPAGPT